MAIVDVSNRQLPKTVSNIPVVINRGVDLRRQGYDITYQKLVSYINGLSSPALVTDRDGLTVELPAGSFGKVQTTTDFEAIVTYKFHPSVKIDPERIFDDKYVESRPAMALLREEIARQVKERQNGFRKTREIVASLKFIISNQELKKKGSDVYLPDLDITVSLSNDVTHTPTHPYSEHGLVLRDMIPPEEFAIGIIINDPNLMFGQRFINIFNEIYRVPVRSDPNMDEGVYIKGTLPVVNEAFGLKQRKKFYTFEEAENLKIFYMTQKEARELGDLAAAYKRETETLKHTMAQEALRLESEIKQANAERDVAAAERKKAEEKHKQQMDELTREHELQLANRRDVMGRIEHERLLEKSIIDHDQSVRNRIIAEEKYRQDRSRNEAGALLDIIKWVPLVLGAIVSMFAVFTKLLPAK